MVISACAWGVSSTRGQALWGQEEFFCLLLTCILEARWQPEQPWTGCTRVLAVARPVTSLSFLGRVKSIPENFSNVCSGSSFYDFCQLMLLKGYLFLYILPSFLEHGWCVLVFGGRAHMVQLALNWLCSWRWPWTSYPPASNSQGLRLWWAPINQWSEPFCAVFPLSSIYPFIHPSLLPINIYWILFLCWVIKKVKICILLLERTV